MSGSGILTLFLASSIIFLLMGLALVLMIIRYQKRMMQQSEEIKEQESIHQEKLLKATIDSQEEERTRIAENLHDGLGAELSAIRLKVLMHDQETEPGESFAENTAEMLAHSIQVVREISHDLHPGALKSYGLMSAWKELGQKVSNATKLTVSIESSGAARRLSDDRELALYRILQELLNNTLRHANAKSANVNINWSEKRLIINYMDDGIGFNAATANKGLGMLNIQSRAQALGGSVVWRSNAGDGMGCTLEMAVSV